MSAHEHFRTVRLEDCRDLVTPIVRDMASCILRLHREGILDHPGMLALATHVQNHVDTPVVQ